MDRRHVKEEDIPLIAPSWTSFTTLNCSLRGSGRNRFPVTTLPNYGGTGFLIVPNDDDVDRSLSESSDFEDDDENDYPLPGKRDEETKIFTAKKYFKDSRLLYKPQWYVLVVCN